MIVVLKGSQASGWYRPPKGTHSGEKHRAVGSGKAGAKWDRKVASLLKGVRIEYVGGFPFAVHNGEYRPVVNGKAKLGGEWVEIPTSMLHPKATEGAKVAVEKWDPEENMVSHIRMNVSSANRVEICELKDGSHAIFKQSEESGNPDSEALTYEISQSLGWDIVPRTVIGELGGVRGSYQQWVDGAKTGMELGEAGKDALISMDGARMAVMDLAFGQDDRNSANWLIKGGRVIAIDNGGMFAQVGVVLPRNSSAWADMSAKSFGEAMSYTKHVAGAGNADTAIKELLDWSVRPEADTMLSKVGKAFGDVVMARVVGNLSYIARDAGRTDVSDYYRRQYGHEG